MRPPDAAPFGIGQHFWTADNDTALTALCSTRDGLSTADAEQRLKQYGPNLAALSRRKSLPVRLGRRLADPMVAILLLAAAVSGATGDWRSFATIVVIVLFSIVLDLVQEQKAEAAIEALKRSVAVTARVRRDGAVHEMPVRELVPGDIVALQAGDLVPADGLLIEGRGATVNEAILTGEPYAVEKRPGRCAATTPTDAFNALFSGTSLVGGNATMVVVATGRATRFGAITASMQTREPPTAFERGIHSLGMLILRLTGFLVLFVLLSQTLRQGLTIDGFLFAVALAVGLTPELLPMITTVTLARGAVRMARCKMVVKRLSAIHDLGAMDVLCTDKTGTLTEARITHIGSFGPDGQPSEAADVLFRRNSRLVSGLRSNLDDAILAGAPQERDDWTHVADLPFDFDRRRASVLVVRGDQHELIVKGAPEELLALSTRIDLPGGPEPLCDDDRARVAAFIDAKGREGVRLLAVARRSMPSSQLEIEARDETDLIFAGLAAFVDPPKASATEAVARIVKAGIVVKIISGDAPAVVRHLVETLHIPASGMLSGDEIARLNDAALAERALHTDLFVRVSPEQKSRIVHALRRRGKTVGFLGDGINDAPAIHGADVGISVEGGTDVAREAADIILLAPDLRVIADGVAEGRRTYANIMKYIRMGTSSNFGNMLSMALASVVLPFLPLLPLQILLNNLIYDLSEIGIPFDRADADDLARPQPWDMGAVLRFTLVMGPLSSLFDAATFALLRLGFDAPAEMFRTAWFVESITTQILVIFVIRTAGPVWNSRPDPVLAATSVGAVILACAMALTPLGTLVGFVALPMPILAAIAAISVSYLLAAEVLKRFALRAPHPRRHVLRRS